MRGLRDDGAVDAALHFEQKHGRRIFVEKNVSQISFGDASYNPFREQKRNVTPLTHDASHATAHFSWNENCLSKGNADEMRPMRRSRGPGTDFARHIEAHGFPADASRRSARVDVVQETLYHYDPINLHTHKRLTRMPFRSKQCDGTLQLFLRPEEAQARAEAQQRQHQQQYQQRDPQRCFGIDDETAASYIHRSGCVGHTLLPQSAPGAVAVVDDKFLTSTLDAHSDQKPLGYEHEYQSTGGESRLGKRSVQLQQRLRLLEELYAREYARLQNLSCESESDGEEREACDDLGEAHDAHHTLSGSFASLDDTLLHQAESRRQASQLSQRRRRTRSSSQEHTAHGCTEERHAEEDAEDGVSSKAALQRRHPPLQPWEREYNYVGELSPATHDLDESDSFCVDSDSYKENECAQSMKPADDAAWLSPAASFVELTRTVSQPQTTSTFHSPSTVRSLRDLCAERPMCALEGTAVPAAGTAALPPPVWRTASTTSKKASQTLRDVCRALQAPL